MQKWEYSVITVEPKFDAQSNFGSHMSQHFGEQGWELVAVLSGGPDCPRGSVHLFFKRPIEPATRH